MHRKRHGISLVVSTVIIFSALIMILVGVLTYANSIFQMQADQSEFSQA
ncbi:MAG: hypothetical protein ABSB40_11820 [Nitrososphaeria archaeon]